MRLISGFQRAPILFEASLEVYLIVRTSLALQIDHVICELDQAMKHYASGL